MALGNWGSTSNAWNSAVFGELFVRPRSAWSIIYDVSAVIIAHEIA